MRASKLSYSLSLCQERDVFVASARTISYISPLKIIEFVRRTEQSNFHEPNVNRLSQTDHDFFSLQTLLN